jgi:hypothetical protein
MVKVRYCYSPAALRCKMLECDYVKKMGILIKTFTAFYLALLVLLPANGIYAATGTASNVKVARAQFTTAIKNREPVDQVVLLGNDVPEVYYFTDLRHLNGKTITHRWEFNGDVVKDIPLKVEGPRWRTQSRMLLDPKMLGKWTVLVLDQTGLVLKATMFEYVPAGLARENPPQ